MFKHSIVLAGALMIAGLTACSTNPVPAEPDHYTQETYPQVVAMGDLEGALAVGRPAIQPAGGGKPMIVSVPVRLLDDEPANAQYRFMFFDANGMPLEPAMEWKYVLLPPKVQTYLEGVSLQKEAADWRLEVQSDKGPYGRPFDRRD